VTLSDGRVLAGRADVRKGDPENPLSAAEKKKKFIDLAERPWGRAGAEKIYRVVRALPDAGSVQDWMAELAAPDL
jgi:2-methylcitrate dehydratase PrpD